MDQKKELTVAAALLGGYALGRTKKGRLALGAAMYLAGKRFDLAPGDIVAAGAKRLKEIPQVAELQEQITQEGLEAARKAATTVAEKGVGSLIGSVGDRVKGLQGGADKVTGGTESDEPESGEDEKSEGAPEAARAPGKSRSRAGSGRSAPAKRRQPSQEERRTGAQARPASGARKKAAPAKRTAPKKKAPASGKAPRKASPGSR
jgi:hypothetical protein